MNPSTPYAESSGEAPTIVIFTRDLRVHDNPALVAARAGGRPTVSLFVLDDRLLGGPRPPTSRLRFLGESLRDLDYSLRTLGGGLVIRRGNWAAEVIKMAAAIGAREIHLTDDHSAFAVDRFQQLETMAIDTEVKVYRHPGVAVVPPAAVEPTGGGEYKVFTPYYRRWSAADWRLIEPVPKQLTGPDLRSGHNLLDDLPSPINESGIVGGETAGRRRLFAWLDGLVDGYENGRDTPALKLTSHLSAYLHLGCLSPLEVALAASEHPAGGSFVRQLCWRDFFLQVLAAQPGASTASYRDRGDMWADDPDALRAWQNGQTGFPLVDAGMRQLAGEGFMHNRARMVTASFLVKDLYLDWRIGARHFMEYLVDGDVASNQLNWQWVAGTGTDSNPHRILNPTRQSERFDPEGAYIRSWVPELADVATPEIHCPSHTTRARLGYPDQIVDHPEAVSRFRFLRAQR